VRPDPRPQTNLAAEPHGAARTTSSGGAQQEDSLSAPLFHSLVDRLGDGGRFVLLDLASARPATVRLLSQFRCRYEVAELADAIDPLNAEQDPRRLRSIAEAALPARRQEPTDIVLCWDLLNYLNRPALTAVMECIAARGRPGTLVHALVYYAARQMPERPSSFLPLDENRLEIVPQKVPLRAAPRYSPEDLATCMPRYAVDRARLLRNGMQEFLFRI
jgi:hypothetical protein